MNREEARPRADPGRLRIDREVSPDDELYWVEDDGGGYHVSACNPSRAATLRAHAEIMNEYGDVFSEFAK